MVYVTTVCDSRKEPVWLRPGFGKLTGKGQIVNIFGFVIPMVSVIYAAAAFLFFFFFLTPFKM